MVGLTMTAWLAAFSVPLALIGGSLAAASELCATGQPGQAWELCRRKWIQASVLFSCASLVALCIFDFIGNNLFFLERMTSIQEMFILYFSLLIHLRIWGISTFFRSNKDEPIALVAVLSAIICYIVSVFATNYGFSVFWGFIAGSALSWAYLELKITALRRSLGI
jgi:hypothetical protein